MEKYGLAETQFSDMISLEEPVFTRSKVPAKKQAKMGKSGKRTAEEIELIREAKKKAQLAKSAQNKEAKAKGGYLTQLHLLLTCRCPNMDTAVI